MEKVGGYPRAGGRFHFEKDRELFENVVTSVFAVPFLLLL